MDAKQCDRCDCFYTLTANCGKVKSSIYGINGFSETEGLWRDLCENCFHDFLKFIHGTEVKK